MSIYNYFTVLTYDFLSGVMTDIQPSMALSSGGNDVSAIIDNDYNSFAHIDAGSDGRKWLKINLGAVYCINRVIWYRWSRQLHLGWTCTEDVCSCTDGYYCDRFTFTVSTVGSSPFKIPGRYDCQYGDTVTVEKKDGYSGFSAYEFAFSGYHAGQ